MGIIPFALVVFALAVVCALDADDLFVSDKMAAKVDAQMKRLDRLVARYMNIERKLAEKLAADKEANKFAQSILNRHIHNKIDGIWRKSDMFQCHPTPQIVNHMAVCDGKDDCDNGYDEQESICRNPWPIGSIWQGVNLYNHCNNGFEVFKNLTIIIEKSHRPYWFGGYVQIRARGHLETVYKGGTFDMSVPLYGAYSLGSRILFLHSRRLTRHRMILSAMFDGVNYDQCSGFYVYEASMESCAEYRFVKVKQ